MQFHYSIVIKRKANVWFYSHVSFIFYMLLNIAVLKQLLRINILRDASGYLFRLLHGEDNGGRAVHYVAAAKNAGASGHAIGALAGNNKAALVHLDALSGGYNARCRLLAYGQNYAIAGQHLLAAFGNKLAFGSFHNILH